MTAINPKSFEFAMKQITDGNVFECFIQDLLCQIEGVDFHPTGGLKDKGKDGFNNKGLFHSDQKKKEMYQISIDKGYAHKIERTIKTLIENKIDFNCLTYVTNQRIKNPDEIMKSIHATYNKIIIIRDLVWLRGHINKSEATIRLYGTFIDSYLHNFVTETTIPQYNDFVSDPRIFVFLRQQWESHGHEETLDQLITDSLILFSLEGTDPDQNKFMSRDKIMEQITTLINYSPKLIESNMDKRLKALSTKPRKIRHHTTENTYCLPFETRMELQEKSLEDKRIYEQFKKKALERLVKFAKVNLIQIKSVNQEAMLERVFCELFKKQGLQFSNFVLKEAVGSNTVDSSLGDIISVVVEEQIPTSGNKEKVKIALLAAIRDIIYSGSNEELSYLNKLSHTYMMLFLLRCDPQVSAFFGAMASKLRVYVGTSILIPAMAELNLDEKHRRHWNLLAGASQAGVKLIVNPCIVKETVGHIRKALADYKDIYQGKECLYSDEIGCQYVNEILTRSYFYNRLADQSRSFEDYIYNFVTPKNTTPKMEDEFIIWLQDTFNIEYVTDESLGVIPDEGKMQTLKETLISLNKAPRQAEFDAKTILSIYQQREKFNEKGKQGVFGYNTWWLSKDTSTRRAVKQCFDQKYVSCYMRTDFLSNYIAFVPRKHNAEKVFDAVFPTLVGVNLSHHIPDSVCNIMHSSINQHTEKSPARIRAIMSDLSNKIKTEPTSLGRNKFAERFTKEQFKK